MNNLEKTTKAQQSVAKKGSGWISSWWHGNSNQQASDGGEVENGLEVTEEQRQELYEAIDWDEEKATVAMSVDMPKDTMKAQIHVKLKRGSFALGSSPQKKHGDDLVTLVFDTVTADITQYIDSMKISAGLGDLRLYDGSTKGTLYKKMIGVKTRKQRSMHLTNIENQRLEEAFDKNPTDMETDPFFSVVFEKKPLDGRADNAVTVKMHHLEIIYNPAIVNEVIRFFKPPQTNMETVNALIEVAGTTLDSWKKQTRAGLEYALESHTTFDLRVDMDAPIIMVPEDCTKKDAWVLVIDAGHINVESNLAPKEAIDKVLAKQGHEYSEEDFKELESLVYDKFTIKLTDTKVLIAESVETSRKEIQNPSGGDMHVIEQIDMNFLCETCIVPKSTQLTKIKISGHLPLISINFSDQKYKTLMNVIDIIVPSNDDDDMKSSEDVHDTSNQANGPKRAMSSSMNDGQKEGNSSSYFGKPVWGASNEEPLFISDSEDSDNETLNETSDSSSRQLSTPSSFHVSSSKSVNDSEVSNEYKQTNFSLSFKIDRVKASLKEARSNETSQEMLLCDLVLEQFLLVFTQRKFDMTVDVSLKTLSVIDQMEHGREFTYLITSDEIRSDSSTSIKEKNLVTVKYRKINPNSPEYCDIDQSVDVELSALNIVVTRSSILTLYNFILSTFTTPTKEPTSRASIASDKHSRRDSVKSEQPKENSENGGGVIKVQICLESLDLILNDDGVRLATGCLSHGDVTVVVKPNTLTVDVKIANFELKDDLTSPDVDPHNLETDHSKTQLLSLEGQELATFRYATYDKDSERYPGYDQLIFLRMGSLRLNFLEHTIHQLVDYGARFAEMKVVYDSAREAAVSSAQQFQQAESLLHFDVRIRSPTLIFPSTDPKRPKDQLIARLGEVSVENTFSNKNLATEQLQRLDKSVLENSIRARVDSVDLKSEFVLKDPDTKEEHKQSLFILEEVHMDFTINIVPHTAGTLRPDTQITGHISDISMNLTESQFKFLMATSNSVTAAFTTSSENPDEVEVVNEDPLTMEAIRSVGATGDGNEPSSGALKDAVQSEMHGKRQSSTDEKDDVWTTLDMTIDFQGIKLELFKSEGSLQQEDLSEWSLASFSLEDSGFKLCTNSDSSMFLELQVASLVLNDTRADIHSEFREIMKRARLDGPQLQLRYETTPQQGITDQFLLLALDTPQIILSVDHVFELQKYLMAPFTVEEATEAQMFAESQKQREANESAEPAGGQQSVSRMKQTQTNKSQNDKQTTSTQAVLRYKINVVDPEITLLANPAAEDSEAIVLSADQVLVSQQSLLTVNVSKIGMFLCAMNNKEDIKIRFVDEFEISVSMESHTSANHNITSIIIDIQALVLRVSYLDISIITNVVNRAIELMGSSESVPSPVDDNPKDDDIQKNDDAAGTLAPPTEARSINTSGLKKRNNIEPYIVMSRETLKLSCQGIQVILIEDLHELPIIDMNLKPFTVMVSDWTKALLVDASFSLYTGFYNAKNSHWEPLIEPWSFNLKVSKALTSDSLDIEFASKRKVEIDLTHSFVEAMLNFSSTTGGQKRVHASLCWYCSFSILVH
ncbi:hypothetical protein INT43_002621 [Umbelopsis isabellina]|uniref:Vacuolar protein sorting-associated protein n=1 Tax=Mortierella isabellina TaxID=91625 RepID=A0A8H7Q5C8_MORIS|nr:hypothetical protein INT43_002621 [Umbelopsis isabellina]